MLRMHWFVLEVLQGEFTEGIAGREYRVPRCFHGGRGIEHLVYGLLRLVLVAAARTYVLPTGQGDAPFIRRTSYWENSK